MPEQGADAELLAAVRYGIPVDCRHRIGVAVSGGGDSIALLHALHRTSAQAGWKLSAVTVDHGLRDEAAAEAEGVARFCAGLGIGHETLRWDHGEISGNLMDQARRARRTLIADWARRQGVDCVAVGHTADDEAESFLMGLARSSGLDGLAGMRHFWREEGVRWIRPVLTQSRASLRAYLRRQGIAWIDDPSNDDDRFARVKARKAMAILAPLGITVEGLRASVAHLKLAQHALQDVLRRVVAADVVEQAGALQISRAAFEAMPLELRRRLVVAAIGWIAGDAYPPRGPKQLNLVLALQAGRDATLGGCRFRCQGNVVRISREAKAVGGGVVLGQLWDGRWRVSGPEGVGLEVRALGAEGLRACKAWRATGLSRDALLVSPAVWRGDVLNAAPLAGFGQGYGAKIDISFDSFLLSH